MCTMISVHIGDKESELKQIFNMSRELLSLSFYCFGLGDAYSSCNEKLRPGPDHAEKSQKLKGCISLIN